MSSISYLQVLRNLYDEGREKASFFDNYDFKFATSDDPNPLSRINKAFYKLFNEETYLPTVVVYFLDDDLFMKPELFLPSEIEAHLRWLFQDFDQAIKLRKRTAPHRSVKMGEPQSYVVKALPRCDVGNDASFLIFEERVNKFNSLLQAIGRCYSIGTINIQTLEADDARNYKPSDGATLDVRGHYKLWREILATLHDITNDIERENKKRQLHDSSLHKRSNSYEDRRRQLDHKRY